MAELIEIVKNWREDSTIDQNDLARESLKIPKLHSKYYEMYMKEKLVLEKFKRELTALEHLYTNYYSGLLSKEELKEHGLEQFDLRVIKSEIPRYLDSTEQIVKVKEAMGVQNEKIEFLRSILQNVHQRTFTIKDAISFMRFQSGL